MCPVRSVTYVSGRSEFDNHSCAFCSVRTQSDLKKRAVSLHMASETARLESAISRLARLRGLLGVLDGVHEVPGFRGLRLGLSLQNFAEGNIVAERSEE